jgi:pSer/pThr/pTyr-binding forkhead associated (FHA) protein
MPQECNFGCFFEIFEKKYSTTPHSLLPTPQAVKLAFIFYITSVPHISVLYPEESRQSVQVPEKGLVIGRESYCDLRLPDVFISSKHCRIFFEDGKFFIEDLGSTNGTTIDGAEIAALQAMPLEPGQTVQIGVTVIKAGI